MICLSLFSLIIELNRLTIDINSFVIKFKCLLIEFNYLAIGFNSSVKGFNSLVIRFNSLVIKFNSFADMVFTFKYVHKLVNCSAADLGIFPLNSITWGNSCRLRQRHPNNKTCANLCCFRAVSTWKKLPSNIVTCKSLSLFKDLL